MSHTNLRNYYEVVFGLAHHHKYSISDIENLIPYERDIYVDLAIAFKKQQEEEARTST